MEIWDLYDAQRRPTGETMIRGGRAPEGRFHLVVDALFLNSKGETLLQRRAKEKDVRPDMWCTTGGAAVRGEESAAAFTREVTEELGFAPDLAHSRLLLTQTNPGRGFIRDVRLFFQDVDISDMRFQPEEVQDAQWILPEKIEADADLSRQLAILSYWKEIYPYLCLESMRIRIPRGVYRHFKGNRYRVEGLALHSETLEPMVLYRALYGAGEAWVRPAAMWGEQVEINGEKTPRFALETPEAQD